MRSSKQAERAGGNPNTYHDPALSLGSEEIARMVEEEGTDVAVRLADHLRFSAKRSDRIRSAVAYSVIAKNMVDKTPHEAVYQYHYAGQGFRLEGMTSKAARNYEKSADLGREVAFALYNENQISKARSLQDFNCRSIGRAVNCYQDSGQFDCRLRCQRKSDVALTDRHLFQGNRIAYAVSQIWGLLFDYSLNWWYGFILLFLLMGFSYLSPQAYDNVAIMIGIISFIAICIRRLNY